MDNRKVKRWISYLILCAGIPAVILTGTLLFQDKQYAWVSLCVALFACVPFFLAFEKGKSGTKRLILIAVMVGIAVIGRILFTPIPGFKPVTAIIVITAMHFGAQAGFMTGAMTAVISNFTFGQGPWTPFQMFVWGLVGLLAGLLAEPLKRNRFALLTYGAISGAVFSLLMDVWTVLWWDGTFHLARYAAATISALGFTVTYALSNVVFLLLFSKPIGRILERIKLKYDM